MSSKNNKSDHSEVDANSPPEAGFRSKSTTFSVTPDESPQLHTASPSRQLTGGIGVRVHAGPLPPPEVWEQYPPDAQKYWMETHSQSRQEAHERAVQAQKDTVSVNKSGRFYGFTLVFTLSIGCLIVVLLCIILNAGHMLPDNVAITGIEYGLAALGILAGASVLQALMKGGSWKRPPTSK